MKKKSLKKEILGQLCDLANEDDQLGRGDYEFQKAVECPNCFYIYARDIFDDSEMSDEEYERQPWRKFRVTITEE